MTFPMFRIGLLRGECLRATGGTARVSALVSTTFSCYVARGHERQGLSQAPLSTSVGTLCLLFSKGSDDGVVYRIARR